MSLIKTDEFHLFSDVTKERDGWCDEETDAVEALKNLIWAVVESILNDVDSDELDELDEVFNAFLELSAEDTSGEEIFNFLKNIASGENTSESLQDFLNFLQSLDNSSENGNEEGETAAENEVPLDLDEDNEESNVIPDVLLDLKKSPLAKVFKYL